MDRWNFLKKSFFFFFFDLSITSVVTRTTCIQRVFVCLNSKFMEKITQYSLIFIIFEIRFEKSFFQDSRKNWKKKLFNLFNLSPPLETISKGEERSWKYSEKQFITRANFEHGFFENNSNASCHGHNRCKIVVAAVRRGHSHVLRVREDPWIIRRLSSRLDPGLRDVWQRKLTVTGPRQPCETLVSRPHRIGMNQRAILNRIAGSGWRSAYKKKKEERLLFKKGIILLYNYNI